LGISEVPGKSVFGFPVKPLPGKLTFSAKAGGISPHIGHASAMSQNPGRRVKAGRREEETEREAVGDMIEPF
jgi:hypothetical protein